MKTENIERYLESFGKQVVNRTKGNIQKAKGGGTDLEKSIRFEIITDKDGFTVNFYMADYGTFVDKGVSGNKNPQVFKDYKNKVIKSPYKYTTKQPPAGIIEKWIKRKGIKSDNKSDRSFAFAIARSIKKRGIKSLSFFQKPLGLGLKQFGKDLLKNVKEDIIDTLNKTTIN